MKKVKHKRDKHDCDAYRKHLIILMMFVDYVENFYIKVNG